MALTGKQFTIRAGEHEVTAVEVGGGLRRYTHAGVGRARPYGEQELPPSGSGGVLNAWPNRLAGGRYVFGGQTYQVPITEGAARQRQPRLARWARWVPVAIDSAALTLACDIVPQTGWPFEIRAEVTYALHPDHGLAVTGGGAQSRGDAGTVRGGVSIRISRCTGTGSTT